MGLITDRLQNALNAYWPEGEMRPAVRWKGVHADTAPTFDPMLGFPNGRAVRESVLTRDQLIDANLPAKTRDYCAHHYVELFGCMRDTSLFQNVVRGKCDPIKHEWETCQYQDYIIRMKEYERERRLRERQKRRIAMGLEADPNATVESM